MSREVDREVAKQMTLLELAERHPFSRYRCAEPGCHVIYKQPVILGPLGASWRCPDHDPDDPRRFT
ncbi:MAG TPA: hypothetical protein VGS14_11025 [Actinomycetes bacterium]|jgi:hypothetical protein|nr:hypothetical protein [Actinomycetes bacterium]